jgi:hypothetical protein
MSVRVGRHGCWLFCLLIVHVRYLNRGGPLHRRSTSAVERRRDGAAVESLVRRSTKLAGFEYRSEVSAPARIGVSGIGRSEAYRRLPCDEVLRRQLAARFERGAASLQAACLRPPPPAATESRPNAHTAQQVLRSTTWYEFQARTPRPSSLE